MKGLVFSALFLLNGCASAEWVNKKVVSEFGPLNDSSKSGSIRYLNQGYSGIITARREDAYLKMYEYCNKKYKIINEQEQYDGAAAAPVFGIWASSPIKYWVINFECVDSK